MNYSKEKLYSLQGAVFLTTVYSFFHIAARMFASPNLGEDDPLENIRAQSFEWGYSVIQPPLYDWVLYVLQSFMGTGLFPFLFIKYGALVLTAALLFDLTRRLTKSALWGLLSVDALALIYQISWRYHEGFTHLVLSMPLAISLFWAWYLILVAPSGRIKPYILFGVLVGLALLSRHIFWLVLAGLFFASFLQNDIRQKLSFRGLLVAAALAVLVTSPYLIWLMTDSYASAQLAQTANDLKRSLFSFSMKGIRRALTKPILFLSPYIFILLLMFPRLWQRIFRENTLKKDADQRVDFALFLLHYFFFVYLVLVCLEFLFGFSYYPPHALNPLLGIMIVWFGIQLSGISVTQGQIRRFVILTIAITLFAFVARSANMFLLEPFCKKCRWGIPYQQLARDIDNPSTGKMIFLVLDKELGGNIRAFLPNAKVLLLSEMKYPANLRLLEIPEGNIKLVWAQTPYKISRKKIFKQINSKLKQGKFLLSGKPGTLEYNWTHLWKATGYRKSRWYIQNIRYVPEDKSTK